MKLKASVVLCGLVLAGCGSGGDATAPAASTSAVSSSASSPKPTVSLTDPGDTAGSVAMTPTNARGTNDPTSASDVARACQGLMTVTATKPFTYTQLDEIYQGLALAQGAPLNEDDVYTWANALNDAGSLARDNARMSSALDGLKAQLQDARVELPVSTTQVRAYWLTVKQECASAGVPSPT